MSMLRGCGESGVRVASGVLVLLMLAACVAADDAKRGVGREFPAMRLPLLDAAGEVVLPADGPIVLNVWATWCEPCRREAFMHFVFRARKEKIGRASCRERVYSGV